MRKGRYACRRKLAFEGFSRVLEICENSPDPSHQEMVAASRLELSFLNEVGLNAPRRARFAPPPPGIDRASLAGKMLDIFAKMMGESAALIDTDEDADDMKSDGNRRRQRSIG
jgi:hypothetical protein